MNFKIRYISCVTFVLLAAIAISACERPSTYSESEGAHTANAEPNGATRTTHLQVVEQSPDPVTAVAELQMLLASSDLSVGPNRFIFGLINDKLGPVRDAQVQISTFYRNGETMEGPIESVPGVFRKWPVGPGGIYTGLISFDRPGVWGVGAMAVGADGSLGSASVQFEVRESSVTPAIGSPAPRSVNKTVRNVDKLEEITTDLDPDPEIYAMTIAEAIDAGKPLVVCFSTPAFCETATCGPQLGIIKALKDKYKNRVNFIHVEILDNPLEMQGDRSKGRLTSTVIEWNLPSEPWTFIVDRGGIISGKFEGFTTSEELEEELASVLQDKS